MSQLDVINAKKALAVRLQIWGCPEPGPKADGFIDDLVAQGWAMQAHREMRPQPPKIQDSCRIPGHEGYRADNCAGCHADQLAGDPLPARKPPAAPQTVSQALAAARAAIVQPTQEAL